MIRAVIHAYNLLQPVSAFGRLLHKSALRHDFLFDHW